MRYPRSQRLSSGAAIERVRRDGARVRCGRLEFRIVIAPELNAPRVGVIVPRYRQTAVARNLVKRRLREIVRQELLPHLAGADVLLRARPEAYAATAGALRADVCAARTRLLRLTGGAPPASEGS